MGNLFKNGTSTFNEVWRRITIVSMVLVAIMSMWFVVLIALEEPDYPIWFFILFYSILNGSYFGVIATINWIRKGSTK